MTSLLTKNWLKITLILLVLFSVFFIFLGTSFAQSASPNFEYPYINGDGEIIEGGGEWIPSTTPTENPSFVYVVNSTVKYSAERLDSDSWRITNLDASTNSPIPRVMTVDNAGTRIDNPEVREDDFQRSEKINQNLDESKASGITLADSNNDAWSCSYAGLLASPVTCTLYALAYVMGWITSFIFFLGSVLIGLALDLNSQVLKFSVIHSGWTFTRDIANLGFVLAILIIAFGIIIRAEEYGSFKILRNLIISALLVNFSLVIAGIILDFAGILTTFFANMGLAEGESISSFSEKLAGLTQMDRLLSIRADSGLVGGAAAGLSGFSTQLLTIFFIILFTVLSAIIFLGIAVMLLIRFVWIAGLLIVMPIAFLASIFPKSQGISKQWWSKFMQWTFFPVTVTFFLSLATQSLLSSTGDSLSKIDNIENFENNNPAFASANGAFQELIALDLGLDTILTMLIVLGFLFMSITFGFAGSIQGAKFAQNWVHGVKNWTINKAKRGTARAAKATSRGAASGLEKTSQQVAEKTKNIPLINKLTARASIAASQLDKTVSRTELDMQKKDLSSKVDPENIATYYQATNAQGRAALMEIAAEKGWLNKLPELDYKSYEKYRGDKKKLSEKDINLTEDKKDNKNIYKALQNKDSQAFSNAMVEKIKSMKPEDFSKVIWGDVISGKNILKTSGIDIDENDWKENYQPEILKAIAQNTYGKEFSNIVKKSSAGDRTEMTNKTIAASINLSNQEINNIITQKKQDADHQTYLFDIEPEDIEKDPQKALKSVNLFNLLSDAQKEELKKTNESLYNFVKNSLHSAGPDSSEEKKSESKTDEQSKQEEKNQ